MKKDKITDLIKLRRKTQVELAKVFGTSPASFNNKVRACETRFSLQDLVDLATATGTRLAFIDENDKPVIVFDPEDIKKDTE